MHTSPTQVDSFSQGTQPCRAPTNRCHPIHNTRCKKKDAPLPNPHPPSVLPSGAHLSSKCFSCHHSLSSFDDYSVYISQPSVSPSHHHEYTPALSLSHSRARVRVLSVSPSLAPPGPPSIPSWESVYLPFFMNYTGVCVFVCMCVCVCIYMCVCMYVHVRACVHMYAYLHIYLQDSSPFFFSRLPTPPEDSSFPEPHWQ